jgi:TRAP-type mannitol/chloroaromatic compound transport system substrate-binding protein
MFSMNPNFLLKRRSFLAGVGAAAALTTVVTKPAFSQERYRWRMVSQWTPDFPDQFVAAQRLAARIDMLSGGRLTIEVLPPKDGVPAEETLKSVRNGSVEMCRSLSYHWRSQSPAFDFFFVAPFGFTQNEMNTWLRYFGGQDLWDEAYAPLGVKAFPSGSLGAQAFGWFRREIESLNDLKGLRFRTTGLGIDVMSKLGVKAMNLKPNEILPAMQSKKLDAFELVGPLVDLHFGLYKAASYYYFPSYNQPSGMIELVVNKAKYDALPSDLQQVLAIAAQAEHDRGLAEANAGNARALNTLITEHGVQVRQLPQDVLVALGTASGEVLEEIRASGDEISKRTIDSFKNARQVLMAWSLATEQSFLNARTLPFTY